jgi:hypothetical protein
MLLLWRPADSGHVPTRCAARAERDSGAQTAAILAVRCYPPSGLRKYVISILGYHISMTDSTESNETPQ